MKTKKQKKQKKTLTYRILYPFVRLFFKKQTILYKQPVSSDEPVVFVCNHAQAFGPMSIILNFDQKVRPWIAADVMFKETAADFVFVQFFAGNIKKHKRWNMFKSKFVAKILVNLFSNVGGIPVYFDRRLVKTMSQSADILANGENIVIFGETPKRFSNFVAEISDGCVQVANSYYKKTGKNLKFYPVYTAPKYITVGEPTVFDGTAPVKEERKRVAEYLRDNMHQLASELPPFTPIPTYTEEYFAAIEQQEKERQEQAEQNRANMQNQEHNQ